MTNTPSPPEPTPPSPWRQSPEAQRENGEQPQETGDPLVQQIEQRIDETFRQRNPNLVAGARFLDDPTNTGVLVNILDEQRVNITAMATMRIDEAAEIIRTNFTPMPEAQRNAFADALKLYQEKPVETAEHGLVDNLLPKYAWAHFRAFLRNAERRRTLHTETSQQARDLMGRGAAESLSEKIGLKNLYRNFKNAEFGEKVVMGAAVVALLLLVKKYWKEKITKDGPTWGTAALWTAAGFALNATVGYMRDDGRTILNMLGPGRTAEQLPKNSTYYAFAVWLGPEGAEEALADFYKLDDEREMECLFTVRDTNMHRVNRVWERHHHDKKYLTLEELIALNIPPEQATRLIDKENPPRSERMYFVIDKLYQLVGRNHFPALMEREARANAESRELSTREQRALSLARNHDFSDIAFLAMSEKYLKEDDPEVTYEKVMVDALFERDERYPGEIRDNIIRHQSQRYSNRMMAFGERTYEGTSRALQSGYRNTMACFGRNIPVIETTFAAGVDFFGIEYTTATEESETAIRGILGQNIPVEMRSYEVGGNGKVAVYGVPLVYRLENNRNTLKIGGESGMRTVEIRSNMSAAEKDRARGEILQRARQKMIRLVGRSTVPGARNLNAESVEWDQTRSLWRIPSGVHVSENQRFGIQAQDVGVAVRIRRDSPVERPQIEFFINRSRISDFTDIEGSYRRTRVSEAIYDAFPQLSTRLGGTPLDPPIPVDIAKAEEQPDHSIRIEGNIGGIAFQKTLQPNESLQDLPSQLQSLSIQPPFIDAYLTHIAENPDFHKPFNEIYHFLNNVNEGLWDRVASAWDTTFLGFLPTNWQGTQAGPIRETRARYTLMYKKAETLFLMGRRMEGRTLGNFQQAVPGMRQIYDSALAEANRLHSTMLTAYNRAGGGDSGSDVIAQNFHNYYNDLLTLSFSPAYRTKFLEFVGYISDDRFTYLLNGAEDVHEGIGISNSHKVFTRLLSIYINRTADYAHQSTPNIQDLENTRSQIIADLDRARSQAGTGIITMRHLNAVGLTEPQAFTGRQGIMGRLADATN